MTQAELDALPEIGGFGYRENGDGTKIPYALENCVMDQSNMAANEPIMVTDLRGLNWMLGYVNGQLSKREIR